MSFYHTNVEIIRIFRNVKKINLEKIYTNPADRFFLHTVEAIGKCKKSVKKMNTKNVQVQLISFYYMNAETIGK